MRRLLQSYQGRSPILTDATLTADSLVIAGSVEGFRQFWDRDAGRLLWTLRAHVAPITGVHAEGNDIVTRATRALLAASRWANWARIDSFPLP